MTGTGAGPGGPLAVRPWCPVVTVVAAALACLLAGVIPLGPAVLFTVVGLAMVGLAGGWVLLLGLPSPRGTTATLTGAVVILLGSGVLSQEARESLLPGAVALAMIVEFVHQLARRDGRPRLVESVSACVTGIAILTSGAAMLLLAGVAEGITSTAVVMSAVAAACLADLGVRREPGGANGAVGAVLALLLGTVAAGVAASLSAIALPLWVCVLAGGLAGAGSHAVRQTQSVLPTLFGRRAQVASGASSVLATGVIAYALTWLSLGPDMMAVALTR